MRTTMTVRNQLPYLGSPQPLPPQRERLLLPCLMLRPFSPPPLPLPPPPQLPPPSTSSPQLVAIWIWPTKKLVSESKLSWSAGLQHEIWKSPISKERSFKMATYYQMIRMSSSKEMFLQKCSLPGSHTTHIPSFNLYFYVL